MLVTNLPDGKLGGIEHDRLLSILMTWMIPPMMLARGARIRARDAAAPGPWAPAPAVGPCPGPPVLLSAT